MATSGWRRPALPAAGLLAMALLATDVGSAEWRLVVLVVGLGAGGLLAERLFSGWLPAEARADGLERLALASGLSLVLALVVAGGVYLLPGPMPKAWLVGLLALSLLGLGLGAAARTSSGYAIRRHTLLGLGAVLLIGGLPRLVDLGYSELQGDEATVMHRATAIVQGVDGAPLTHRKGPGELLLAALAGQLVGRVAEADVRMPFALTSLAGLLAFFALGRALFGERAGLVASLLWAINGFGVAFGRIVQYHSAVLLLSALATLCIWRAQQTPAGSARWLALAGLFLVVGLIYGFNIVFLAVPAGYLLLRQAPARINPAGLWRDGGFATRALAAGAALGGLAFVLYVVRAWPDLSRYAALRVGRGQPFNNLDSFGGVAVMYLSLPYLVLTGLAGLAAVCWLIWGGQKGSPARLAVALTIAVGALALVVGRGQPTALALGIWVLLVAELVVFSAAAAQWKAVAFGAVLPFGLYAFWIERPGTHWYELYPSLLLLIGAAVDRALRSAPAALSATAVPLGCVVLLGLAAYPAGTFLPIWPTGLVPQSVVHWYRPELGRPKHGGVFGYPHQDGWKAVARLEAEGRLPLPYDSNAQPEVTRWYLPAAERCRQEEARSFLVADTPRGKPSTLPGVLAGTVTVGREETMLVVTDGPPDGGPFSLQAEAAAGWFDAERSTLARPLEMTPVSCRQRPIPAWRQ